MDTKEQLQEIVYQIMAEQLNTSVDKVKKPNFIMDLHVDSLDMIEFVMELESHFSMSISDEVAETFREDNELSIDIIVSFILENGKYQKVIAEKNEASNAGENIALSLAHCILKMPDVAENERILAQAVIALDEQLLALSANDMESGGYWRGETSGSHGVAGRWREALDGQVRGGVMNEPYESLYQETVRLVRFTQHIKAVVDEMEL